MFDSCHPDIKAHALEAYPNEACGLIVAGEYIRAENIAAEPETSFEIDPAVVEQYLGEIEAVVHSHPDGPDHPSAQDMAQQIAWDLPFGIVTTDGVDCMTPFFWGDSVDQGPLIGRQFRPGVTDCYGLVRAWYWEELGIRLPDFPRDADWWDYGQNLLLENFERAGFVRIPHSEARPGDVFFCMIRSPVPNHSGVILPDQKILHQLPRRSSRREAGAPWARMFHTIVRYEGSEA